MNIQNYQLPLLTLPHHQVSALIRHHRHQLFINDHFDEFASISLHLHPRVIPPQKILIYPPHSLLTFSSSLLIPPHSLLTPSSLHPHSILIPPYSPFILLHLPNSLNNFFFLFLISYNFCYVTKKYKFKNFIIYQIQYFASSLEEALGKKFAYQVCVNFF